jgi:hypothetical protein
VARGWESKSVEDQISERQAASQNPQKDKLSPQELERKAKRASIVLARTRTLTALESSRDDRYRALLQRTLEHLDSELEKLS